MPLIIGRGNWSSWCSSRNTRNLMWRCKVWFLRYQHKFGNKFCVQSKLLKRWTEKLAKIKLKFVFKKSISCFHSTCQIDGMGATAVLIFKTCGSCSRGDSNRATVSKTNTKSSGIISFREKYLITTTFEIGRIAPFASPQVVFWQIVG